MRIFPALYELKENGKIKVWSIRVVGTERKAEIITEYGEQHGKTQKTSDVIREGKNIGKANETTPIKQAIAEAQSKWEGKKKKGYVESLQDAVEGKLDKIITGGIEPMLAHIYAKHADKIVYPAFGQPKLDGIRCIAIKIEEEVTLWSRTRKPIKSCPHIEKAIRNLFDYDVILDGELYNHDYKDQFEKITSAVNSKTPTEQSKLVQYHIYDTVNEKPFVTRRNLLTGMFELPLVAVETFFIDNEKEMFEAFELYTGQGYEGLMIRNAHGKYENKRSYHLQKVKEFDDAEFKIIGVNEGRGKLQGKLGTFTCVTKNGDEFEVKMTGNEDDNTKYLKNPKLWKGKKLTVKFQGYTNKNLVPRFPVGLRIREAE